MLNAANNLNTMTVHNIIITVLTNLNTKNRIRFGSLNHPPVVKICKNLECSCTLIKVFKNLFSSKKVLQFKFYNFIYLSLLLSLDYMSTGLVNHRKKLKNITVRYSEQKQ